MNATVLIVNGDDALRSGMKTLLRASGHTDVATGATLAEARSHLDAAGTSRLILDLNLPDGLGTDLLRQFQRTALGIRLMLLTGSEERLTSEEAAII